MKQSSSNTLSSQTEREYRLQAKPAPTGPGLRLTAMPCPGLPFHGRHPHDACNYMDHYSFTDPWGMEGWVGLVGWPIADALPTKCLHVNHGPLSCCKHVHPGQRVTKPSLWVFLLLQKYTGWPNTKSATSELQLNHFENRPIKLDFCSRIWMQKSTRVLSVNIKYSMRDAICDDISYCASSFDVGKIKCIWLNSNQKEKRWSKSHYRPHSITVKFSWSLW